MSSAVLFTIGRSKFTTRHLLIVGILCVSFSVSFLARSMPAQYGFELHEFDPFFNYRATEFILQNGVSEYFEWHDYLSWHPDGRDVSATSQIMLHLTAVGTYHVFGAGSDLYDFTIVLPVVFGSLTTIVIFALVRVIAGTTAGLFASLFFSLSLPIILRGMLGWFKSEPLGIFYALLAVYLFLSGIRAAGNKVAILKMVGGGILLGFGLGSWGGIQFFVMPLGVFIMALPFIRQGSRPLAWRIPLFVSVFLLTVLLFERPGADFVIGLGGLALIVPTIFFVGCSIIQNLGRQENRTRNCLAFLSAVILLSSSLLVVNEDAQFLDLPSFRYLNAINPFLTTTNPLTDSVAEHATTSIKESFFFHSVLMIFGALGVWVIFKKTNSVRQLPGEMAAFALIIGIFGIYISSAFIRLEVFASISIIILSSIGLSALFGEISNNKFLKNPEHVAKNTALKGSFFAVIVLLLIVPFLMPASANWLSTLTIPPVILNGATAYSIATDDWLESLEWIKNNTPQDAVIAAWWDYGYWISTMSERTTIVDNATLNSEQIEKMATMFLSTPDEGWQILQEMDADYVVIFVAGQRLAVAPEESFYILGGGGDESKKQWFMKIAEQPLSKYLQPDGETGTDYFWNETLLGRLFPFSTQIYVNFENNFQTEIYRPGLSAIYAKDIKYPADNNDEPFKLVYASPSYTKETPGPMLGVFIYEINHDYVPAENPQ